MSPDTLSTTTFGGILIREHDAFLTSSFVMNNGIIFSFYVKTTQYLGSCDPIINAANSD